MTFSGKEVVFRLSPEGQSALQPVFPAEAFRARVVEEDLLGVWILLEPSDLWNLGEPVRVTLLKWNYFSTAELDAEPEEPELSVRVGFR